MLNPISRLAGQLSLIATISLVYFASKEIQGQTSWANATNGSFHNSANWTNGVPDSTTTTNFNTGGQHYTVDFSANAEAKRIFVGQGEMLTFSSGSLFDLDLSESSVIDGDLELDGINLNVLGGELFVGSLGSGHLILNGNSSATSNVVVIGETLGGTGLVELNGPNAFWQNFGTFVVGDNGMGTLNLTSGASLSSQSMWLGTNDSGRGFATVRDSSITIADTLYLGRGNGGRPVNGSLEVVAGGTVNAPTTYMGFLQHNNSSLILDGQGSLFDSDNMSIGFSGNAIVRVQAGGHLNTNTTGIGVRSSGSGNVTIVGINALWTNLGQVEVGDSGVGYVSVESGGSVSTGNVEIGLNDTATGTISVDGNNSTWNANEIYVGSEGMATLQVTNGGRVTTSGDVWSGIYAGSNGTVEVSGAGSELHVGDDFFPSYAGQSDILVTNGGHLKVGDPGNILSGSIIFGSDFSNRPFGDTNFITSNGGKVTANHISINQKNGGTVEIRDVGSEWNVTRGIVVGTRTDAELAVSNGGIINSGSGQVGGTGNHGRVTLASGGEWNIQGDLNIGSSHSTGTGHVLLQGGRLIVWEDLTINTGSTLEGQWGSVGFGGDFTVTGLNARLLSPTWNWQSDSGSFSFLDGAKAHVQQILVNNSTTISGTDTKVVVEQDFMSGTTGVSTTLITNGGSLTSFNGRVGQFAGSSGNLTVNGVDSLWQISNTLYVGYEGTGVLTVQNGGEVNAVYTAIGRQSNSSGTVNVHNANSLLGMTGTLSIGTEGGTGQLNISSGGRVTNFDAIVGEGVGGIGVVTVEGVGTTWSNSDTLTVGFEGTGTLEISNGGVVESLYGRIGQLTGSSGSVNIFGNGSMWNVTNSTYLGGFGGHGELRVESDGNFQSNDSIYVAGYNTAAGGTGSVSIKSGGTVDLQNRMWVWDDGSLSIEGGHLTSDELLISPTASFNMSDGSLDARILKADELEISGGVISVDVMTGYLQGNEIAFTQSGGIFAPGESPGSTLINGDYQFIDGVLEIELGGLNSGTEFDFLSTSGNFSIISGALDVSLVDGFELSDGDEFLFFSIDGTQTGSFDGLGQGSLVGVFGDHRLFIDYLAGDGNDIRLYATAVPEPTSFGLFLLGGLCLVSRNRKGR